MSIAQSIVPVPESTAVHQFTSEQVEIIKNSVAKGVSDHELAYFLEVCRSTGLNPLHRQIYAITRSGKMTIQTGIDGYRLLAHRSRRHVGTDDAVYDTESAVHPGKATVTVYKHVQGQRCAYTATARWKEYAQETSPMWNKMPYLMLAKVAEALALRKAFPAETSGLYTDEEMDQADSSLPARIAAPVTIVEATATLPEVLVYKKSTQDRWDELHTFALKLGFTEAVWRAAMSKYPSTSAMSSALDAFRAQHKAEISQEEPELEEGPEVVEPQESTTASAEEMAAWDQLHARASTAGISVAEWDEIVTGSDGDIAAALEFVKRAEHNLRKVPAGKGRH